MQVLQLMDLIGHDSKSILANSNGFRWQLFFLFCQRMDVANEKHSTMEMNNMEMCLCLQLWFDAN